MSSVYYSPRGGGLWLSANFAEAASPIKVSWRKPGHNSYDDSADDWQSTPFQVADARHNPREAARMVSKWAQDNSG